MIEHISVNIVCFPLTNITYYIQSVVSIVTLGLNPNFAALVCNISKNDVLDYILFPIHYNKSLQIKVCLYPIIEMQSRCKRKHKFDWLTKITSFQCPPLLFLAALCMPISSGYLPLPSSGSATTNPLSPNAPRSYSRMEPSTLTSTLQISTRRL